MLREVGTMQAITIRPLKVAELGRVKEIDVTESGTTVYQQVGRRVVATDEEWQRPPRSEAQWRGYIGRWVPMLKRGGTAIGAFDGDTLVAIAVLRPRLTECMAQLAAL